MTNLRKQITGSLNREDLMRLKFPMAAGFGVEDVAELEADFADLANEGLQMLEEIQDVVAVEVTDGEIVSVEVETE